MIKLLVLFAIHMVICIAIDANSYSEPTRISDRNMPGLEECSRAPQIGFDGSCMDRNHARIIGHVKTHPVDKVPQVVSPALSPAVTLVMGFLVWNLARKMKSRWGVYVAVAGYGIGTALGFLNLLDVFALCVSALAVLVLHLLSK